MARGKRLQGKLLERIRIVPARFKHDLAGTATLCPAQIAGEGGNSFGFDMAPETNQRVVEEISTAMAPGAIKPTWSSLQENYAVPGWFRGGRFLGDRVCLD
jgi:hypothetical protein